MLCVVRVHAGMKMLWHVLLSLATHQCKLLPGPAGALDTSPSTLLTHQMLSATTCDLPAEYGEQVMLERHLRIWLVLHCLHCI